MKKWRVYLEDGESCLARGVVTTAWKPSQHLACMGILAERRDGCRQIPGFIALYPTSLKKEGGRSLKYRSMPCSSVKSQSCLKVGVYRAQYISRRQARTEAEETKSSRKEGEEALAWLMKENRRRRCSLSGVKRNFSEGSEKTHVSM